MTLILSAQQSSFYTNNRYLELEEFLTPSECATFLPLMAQERDLWRKHALLKEFILSRRLSKLALHITGKPVLQLACDQWFAPGFCLEKPTKFKDLFSVQGISCIIVFQLHTGTFPKPSKMAPLGLFPFPKAQGNALIVNSDLLINWQSPSSDIGLYAIAFSQTPAVYVQNTRDLSGHFLKQLGYGYGDVLNHETHPRITV